MFNLLVAEPWAKSDWEGQTEFMAGQGIRPKQLL